MPNFSIEKLIKNKFIVLLFITALVLLLIKLLTSGEKSPSQNNVATFREGEVELTPIISNKYPLNRVIPITYQGNPIQIPPTIEIASGSYQSITPLVDLVITNLQLKNNPTIRNLWENDLGIYLDWDQQRNLAQISYTVDYRSDMGIDLQLATNASNNTLESLFNNSTQTLELVSWEYFFVDGHAVPVSDQTKANRVVFHYNPTVNKVPVFVNDKAMPAVTISVFYPNQVEQILISDFTSQLKSHGSVQTNNFSEIVAQVEKGKGQIIELSSLSGDGTEEISSITLNTAQIEYRVSKNNVLLPYIKFKGNAYSINDSPEHPTLIEIIYPLIKQ